MTGAKDPRTHLAERAVPLYGYVVHHARYDFGRGPVRSVGASRCCRGDGGGGVAVVSAATSVFEGERVDGRVRVGVPCWAIIVGLLFLFVQRNRRVTYEITPFRFRRKTLIAAVTLS